MREQWGGLFEQPEVKLVTEDGRSYVRRSTEKYDAIISVQTMTTAAITSGPDAVGVLSSDARGLRGLFRPPDAGWRSDDHAPAATAPQAVHDRARASSSRGVWEVPQVICLLLTPT